MKPHHRARADFAVSLARLDVQPSASCHEDAVPRPGRLVVAGSRVFAFDASDLNDLFDWGLFDDGRRDRAPLHASLVGRTAFLYKTRACYCLTLRQLQTVLANHDR